MVSNFLMVEPLRNGPVVGDSASPLEVFLHQAELFQQVLPVDIAHDRTEPTRRRKVEVHSSSFGCACRRQDSRVSRR